MEKWFQESDFWERLYPILFPKERFENSAQEVEKIVSLTGISKGEVLDLCCGPGRHALELARLGFLVTGVDVTPFLLEKGKEVGKEEGLDITWIKEDMGTFIQRDTFDLVVNLFTSFGFFETQDENKKVLKNIYQSLKKGGVVLFDLMGKEILARLYQKTKSRELPDGSLFIEKNEIIDGWRRVKNHWILLKDGSYHQYHFKIFIYSGGEMVQMLTEIGFKETQIFGGFGGEPYDNEANRLVVLARK